MRECAPARVERTPPSAEPSRVSEVSEGVCPTLEGSQANDAAVAARPSSERFQVGGEDGVGAQIPDQSQAAQDRMDESPGDNSAPELAQTSDVGASILSSAEHSQAPELTQENEEAAHATQIAAQSQSAEESDTQPKDPSNLQITDEGEIDAEFQSPSKMNDEHEVVLKPSELPKANEESRSASPTLEGLKPEEVIESAHPFPEPGQLGVESDVGRQSPEHSQVAQESKDESPTTEACEVGACMSPSAEHDATEIAEQAGMQPEGGGPGPAHSQVAQESVAHPPSPWHAFANNEDHMDIFSG